ncbi:hypothetical protein [Streptomyces sp. NPDC008125]|uniref:hypothetical protein n=1 Tax=Streptomyces sp. NPDC008125 TaxID=3364811 RepID=UPI0036F14EEE
MTRLQIMELPEGSRDERAPFVLVVDQCPDRWESRAGSGDQLTSHRWREAAQKIGAVDVIVTAETVEIPANELLPVGAFELVGDQAARAANAEDERMREITDALGFDRLQNWDEIVSAIRTQRQVTADGEHMFGEPGYLDPQRCARCGLGRDSWMRQRDTRTCSTVRADAESGHEFRPIGAHDELACLRCRMPRIEWAARRDTPQCDVVRQGGE